MLGLNGGINGTGQNLTAGTNSAQLNTAYGGAQNSLQSQQALLNAIQGQNGLGNQSQIYNQLQGVVNGTGPNPAQAQLAQATGTNVANQAALMAGQRGAGANVGLMARQAAQQGANTQQQAAGQAATLQAQQSLGALGQAGNLANTQAANQIAATGANTQAQQNEQSMLQNANSSMNQQQAGLAGQQMQGQQGIIGGLLGPPVRLLACPVEELFPVMIRAVALDLLVVLVLGHKVFWANIYLEIIRVLSSYNKECRHLLPVLARGLETPCRLLSPLI